MRKAAIFGLVLLLSGFGLFMLTGCGGDTSATTTTAAPTSETTAADAAPNTETTEAGSGAVTPLDPPVTVKVAFDDAPGTAGIILADKMGFFDEVGIKIEYVKFASGAQMYTSLAAGQVDVGRGIITASLFNGAAQGVPVWVVADSGTNEPNNSYFTVVVRRELADKIKDFSDLKGLNVGLVSRGGIPEYFLRKALQKGGLTLDDVKLTIISEFPDLNTGLANGAIDATVQIEPLITIGEENDILTYWKDADEYAPGEQVAVLLYSDKFAKNPEVANRWMLAHLKGVRVYNDALITGDKDRDAVVDMLTKNTFIDDPAMWPKMRPTGLDPNGTVLDDAVAGQQDFYKEIDQVDETVGMDKVIDMSFAKWAVDKLGEYTPAQ